MKATVSLKIQVKKDFWDFEGLQNEFKKYYSFAACSNIFLKKKKWFTLALVLLEICKVDTKYITYSFGMD